ncbi:Ferulic acid decarboxylase 1 [Fusarium falciforme]|nr:Ferulic acid decarboxylase 1 [Fusarium falciforme]
MATSSPEETPKSSAQSYRRFIQELQDENNLVAIDSEVEPHLELAAIVRNVYETEDKTPLSNNVKGREENGLFRILGAPVGASKIPRKTYFGLPSL